MTFTPHTDAQIKEMLKTIDMNSIEDLFKEIPKDLIIKGLDVNVIGDSLTELEAQQEFAERAKRDSSGLCFIGAGAYQHHIPAAVWQVTSRGEFLTAYTPYQAEASQGTLQLLYEYQSMIASLLGLDVSNASLYDGATSLAEAILMAVRCHKKAKSKRILIPTTLHPLYRKAIKTTVSQQGIELIEVPFDAESGMIAISTLEKFAAEEFTALVIPQPNFFGVLEDVDALCNFAHQHNAMAIAVVNPTAMALLKEPGSWGNKGADIACGEGQPLGVPLASGGPYFGFIACKEEYVRQMPGRIIGRTVDLDGKTGFALTLQAREQHIRRAKATSNICTNQGLLVTAATIYLSLLGYSGLRKVAEVCHENSKILKELLKKIPGVEIVFDKPFFHEFVIRFSKPVKNVLSELNARGIQAGFSLTEDYPELGESILVCVTETKTMKDLEMYRDKLIEL